MNASAVTRQEEQAAIRVVPVPPGGPLVVRNSQMRGGVDVDAGLTPDHVALLYIIIVLSVVIAGEAKYFSESVPKRRLLRVAGGVYV